MTKTWALSQIEMQGRIASLANVNVITCCDCGNVFYHDMKQEIYQCGCGYSSNEPSDFPDFWCSGTEVCYPEEPTEEEIDFAAKIFSGERFELGKMILRIKNHEDKSALIDYIDGVQVCENFENTFNVANFLSLLPTKD